jgi:hypothetical protein
MGSADAADAQVVPTLLRLTQEERSRQFTGYLAK